jgi:hypothetical protein
MRREDGSLSRHSGRTTSTRMTGNARSPRPTPRSTRSRASASSTASASPPGSIDGSPTSSA